MLEAFEIMDNTDNHVPAYFPFIPGMPMMVTKNVFQSLGVANGSDAGRSVVVKAYSASSVEQRAEQ